MSNGPTSSIASCWRGWPPTAKPHPALPRLTGEVPPMSLRRLEGAEGEGLTDDVRHFRSEIGRHPVCGFPPPPPRAPPPPRRGGEKGGGARAFSFSATSAPSTTDPART